MKAVSKRASNPFGMSAPALVDEGRTAVYGYGDVDADFHVIGDYPGVHGGHETGVPFTGSEAGRRLRAVLADRGLLAATDGDRPTVDDCYLGYVHPSVTPGDRRPTDAEYADAERFFDAELRAVNAHVLLPVGERAIRHVLEAYTTLADRVDAATAHATEVRGRGFLVVPVRDPAAWSDGDADALGDALAAIQARDYRQTKGVPTLVG